MFSQASSSRAAQPETWAAIAAALTAIGIAAKKFLTRKQSAKPDYITRTEFHQELTATRDRIGAGYLALGDKLEANHKELVARLDRHASAFEHRLDRLESSVARLDERANPVTLAPGVPQSPGPTKAPKANPRPHAPRATN
jgi:hypothetical protein